MRVLHVLRYLYTLKSKLIDQLKFSFIKNRVSTKTNQMLHEIYKDNPKISGESKRNCSRDRIRTIKFYVYSKSRAGLFCFACVFFTMQIHQGSMATILITHPCHDWKHLSEDL